MRVPIGTGINKQERHVPEKVSPGTDTCQKKVSARTGIDRCQRKSLPRPGTDTCRRSLYQEKEQMCQQEQEQKHVKEVSNKKSNRHMSEEFLTKTNKQNRNR